MTVATKGGSEAFSLVYSLKLPKRFPIESILHQGVIPHLLTGVGRDTLPNPWRI